MMKLSASFITFALVQTGLGHVLQPRDDIPTAVELIGDLPVAKIQDMEPHNFKDKGTKRVKMSYGPLVLPGSNDTMTHGMKSFSNRNATMPCYECLITGYQVDLLFEDGTTANANKGMWLHHIGLMNLNRTDAACEDYPERITVNGNERMPYDFTVGGTRMAGYYMRNTDEIFFSTDVMNESELPRTVFLAMEWEYVEGVPDDWEITIPVWLDVKGGCLNESTGVGPEDVIFNATTTTGWSPNFTGDLYLMVAHVHDGNTKQEVYLDGKKICENTPRYGESEDFITHVGMYGHEKEEQQSEHESEQDHEHDQEQEHEHDQEQEHEHEHDQEQEHEHDQEQEHEHDQEQEHEHEEESGSQHDHGSDDHIMHISSITECTNGGMVGPGNKVTLTSFYDMSLHTAMKDHDGELEPIMGIEFLHVAREKDAAIKDIMAMKPPGLTKFLERVRAPKL